MANRRMIDKKISVSEDIASLPLVAQLLFTWMICHSDDVGLLPYSSRAIKALVIPMLEIRVEDVQTHLETMRKQGLIEVFSWEGDKFWRIKNFLSHQTLKRDRKPQTIAKNMVDWNTVKSIWKTMETQVSKEVSKKGSSTGYKKFMDAKKQIGKKI